MTRKDFITKGILGTMIFSAKDGLANVVQNDIDELHSLDVIGFNHLP